ncbi:MAG: Mandelate racemase/muconate lactonizing protein [Frankiales bacterium]|jgi:O-succinylbenzoate synthase|nr:Mandelate racemase/muconate lactonizing protein [Frankiales bacterium]
MTLGEALEGAEAHVVALPMRVPFRGVQVREALLLRGPAGWGEFSPFLEYDDGEAARWLAAAVEAAWQGWPPAVRDSVPVNATVPAVPAAEVAGVLARFPGCTTAKVKVAEAGQALRDDVDRVAAVREVLGAGGRLRVDANAAWSVDDALTALRALAPYDLEYAEQPCATIEELARLRVALARAALAVPVAADESIRKAQDPARVAVAGAADLVVVKVAPLSGVRRALAVAEGCGLPVVVSSALDTSVGLAAGIALAAALPDLPYACGLGTAALLAADVTAAPLLPVGGALRVGAVAPDPELLERYAAPPDRQAWWRARLARCGRLLR